MQVLGQDGLREERIVWKGYVTRMGGAENIDLYETFFGKLH
jgi:hypothetical protein